MKMRSLTVGVPTGAPAITPATGEPGNKPTEKYKPRQVNDTKCHSGDDPEASISVLSAGMEHYLANRHVPLDMRTDPGG